MVIKISGGKIISDNNIITGKSLFIRDGKVLYVTDESLPFDKGIDAGGNYVSAGFIDMHTHGGGGCDFMDGGPIPITEAAKLHLSHGTTSILPTSLACSTQTLMEFIADVKQVMTEKTAVANIIGVHLEGPYFSVNQRGAQNPDYIKPPDRKEYEEIIEFAGRIIKRWSFAPELDGSVAFCKTLLKNSIVPAIAHSDAVYSDVKNICDCGCGLVTHFYSGMSTITRHGGFRELGVIESAYLLDDMSVEIIADGRHLPPELLRLICKLKGIDKISLVTDSMRGAGMGEGPSLLGRVGESMPCIIEDGVAKLPDRSAFAGSVATADILVRTMVKEAGVSIPNAVKMMTKNPASILGLLNKGDIADGFDADIVIFDEDINIKNVIVMGNLIDGID
ncbi:MAG: N-acetylglucosamine-6-phosphate deacetylase [Oscillospiraceae bacterium]|nr:N-acetylglucosamine-6-phosphate deacetylase [Oscillospiraceae bacterium]